MNSGQTNPIVFFGTEDFSAASLQALIDNGFTIAAAVTKQDTKKGRGRTLVPPAVKSIAETHGIPVWQPKTLADIIPNIQALQPVAGVLVSFGKIIPQAMIDLFTPGVINVHPSRLPHYRGPSPIESAILNGDTETGVSIMQLSAKMDAGPVYHFTPYSLTGTETQESLYQTLGTIGAETLVATLPAILSGSLLGTPQQESDATYCQLLKKSDGTIDWSESATAIERKIRAYTTWPGSRTTIDGTDVIIIEAHISHEPTELSFICGDGAHIAIDALKPAGKNVMTAKAFLAGRKNSAK